MNFFDYHENLIDDLNSIIENSTSPIYLFGAYLFTQYLIAFGLKTAKIIC
jgi:hypothetical protein